MKRESKPTWSDVPQQAKDALARIVEGSIADATIAWGGYGPSATFILRTADGRKFFCKGIYPELNEVGKAAFHSELSHYRSIPELRQFGPAFHGEARHEGWHLLVLDCVERTLEVPPWSEAAFHSAIAMLARFHSGSPASARELLPIAEEQFEFMALYRAENGWKSLANPVPRAGFLALFSDHATASRWLDPHVDDFIALEAQAVHIGGPRSWVHHDVRSDNLIFHGADAPLLVDFPYLAYGPTLMDVAFFLPSVSGEGGPSPMEGLRLYEHMSGYRFAARDAAIVVATVAGFFAARAGLAEIPDLPRLRHVQKLQLFPSLTWLSEVMEIDPPPLSRPF
ncbi:MAG: aminoglycoside phosphotransferase family protein [Candidatus Binataceae bacterium]